MPAATDIRCGCGGPAVHGRARRSLTHLSVERIYWCAPCFVAEVRRLVGRAVDDHEMLADDDRALLCVSGEKDSTVMMHLMHEVIRESFPGVQTWVLAVDEGMSDYRTKCVDLVERHCERLGLRFLRRSFSRTFGTDLQIIAAERPVDGPRICQYCCILRGQIVKEVATELGASVILTGANLDDGAEYALTSMIRGQLTGDGLPAYRPPGSNVRFAAPLSYLTSLDIGLFARLSGIDVMSEDCVNCQEHLRDDIRHSLGVLEDRQPGVSEALFMGYQALMHAGQRLDLDRSV